MLKQAIYSPERKCILNFKDYFDDINNLYGYWHFYADIRETVGDRNKREDFDQCKQKVLSH